jgi:Ca2+-binding RTX toxin-like protein
MSGFNSRAKRLLSSLSAVPGAKPRSRRRPGGLAFESLESRRVFATDLPTIAVLDFDGDALTSAEMAEGGWVEEGATSVPSFTDLFNQTRPFLDMDGNATVDAADAQLAISAILAKVKEDFSPYRLTVKLGDQYDHQHLLRDGTTRDVIVMVTGGGDFINDKPSFGVQSGLFGEGGDVGNAHDEIVWAFGQVIANQAKGASDFVNRVAQTISHEMGHAFGLKHAPIESLNESMKHLIMGVPSASFEQRDFNKDFQFQDISFAVEGGGTQNTHQLLTQTLGASPNPWVAVLRPGELTIHGTESTDQIQVAQMGNDWRVSVNFFSKMVNVHGFGNGDLEGSREALNPYISQLNTIIINALGGDDTIQIGGGKQNLPITAATFINAGSGNDLVRGGAGRDTVWGGIGDDILYGLAGDDSLYGQDGLDQLFGGTENDWLDGGADYLTDILRGEQGDDTFVRYARTDGLFSTYELENTDFNASGIDRYTTTFLRRLTRTSLVLDPVRV